MKKATTRIASGLVAGTAALGLGGACTHAAPHEALKANASPSPSVSRHVGRAATVDSTPMQLRAEAAALVGANVHAFTSIKGVPGRFGNQTIAVANGLLEMREYQHDDHSTYGVSIEAATSQGQIIDMARFTLATTGVDTIEITAHSVPSTELYYHDAATFGPDGSVQLIESITDQNGLPLSSNLEPSPDSLDQDTAIVESNAGALITWAEGVLADENKPLPPMAELAPGLQNTQDQPPQFSFF